MTNREFLKDLMIEDRKNFNNKEIAAINVYLESDDACLDQRFVDFDEAFKYIDVVCMNVA